MASELRRVRTFLDLIGGRIGPRCVLWFVPMRTCTAYIHAFQRPVSTGTSTWASAAGMRVEAALRNIDLPRGT